MAVPSADRVAYIAALPGEARALARLPALGSARRGDGSQVILGGMGAARAAAAAERAIAAGAHGLVSWGVAAALAPGWSPGDLLLAERILGAAGREFAVDTDWRAAVAEGLDGRRATAPITLAETRTVLASTQSKTRLHEATGAEAADMESAAIAAVAAAHGVSFIAIRVVLDDARMTLPPAARAAMDEAGHLRPVALTRAMLGRPLVVHTQLRGLKHLAVAFRAARMTLADVVPALAIESAA